MLSAKRMILTALITLLVLVTVRVFFFEVVSLSSNSRSALFLKGDRILVFPTSYGVRLPFSSLFGSHTFFSRQAEKGDWILYRSPLDTAAELSDRETLIGQVFALPGDTVWFSWSGSMRTGSFISSRLFPLIVPGRNEAVTVRPWNAALLFSILSSEEKRNDISLKGDTLLLQGKRPLRSIRMQEDYYWIYSGRDGVREDSRLVGFVPQSHLIGRAAALLFSRDGQKPFFQSLRRERWMKPLSREVVFPNP